MARQDQSSRPDSIKLSLTSGLIGLILCGFICAQRLPGQTRSGKRTAASPAKGAQPKPTPTSTRLKTLGAPPPVPVLKKKEEEIKPGDVISVNTSEVMLPVTVRDSSGRLIKDLTRRDFRVFEDGNEQPLSDLALRQVPVDIVLMVDSSSSVTSNLDDFRRAVEGFATRLAPEDRISLIKFDDRVELLQDWTQSKFQLHRALNRIQAGMFTRFNDALMLAAREQFVSAKSRRAVIVLTDGIDSGRGATAFESALQGLLQAQVTVYVVSNTEIERAAKKAELDSMAQGTESELRFNEIKINDLREGLRVIDLSEERLEQLTTATGGRLYKPKSFDALDATYAEVADELRHQYSLYYTPLNRKRDGSFRRVIVETDPTAYHASTRVGYFAPRD
ncbi:MAG: Ca-activated chloride channel [Blastocatellia bacterium]|nr:Ca-activated chloride channel [Blastocatellia bacterium]